MKYPLLKTTIINKKGISINKRVLISGIQGNYIALPIPLWCPAYCLLPIVSLYQDRYTSSAKHWKAMNRMPCLGT